MENKNDILDMEIKITWQDTKPVKFQLNGNVIWVKEDDNDDADCKSYDTTIILPSVEAVRFSVIFINGLSAAHVTNLLCRANAKLSALNEFKDKMLLEDEFSCSGGCETCEDREECIANEANAVDGDEDDNEWENDEDEL